MISSHGSSLESQLKYHSIPGICSTAIKNSHVNKYLGMYSFYKVLG